jgi:hypothetical protein
MTIVINYTSSNTSVRIQFVKRIEQVGERDILTETFGNGPVVHRGVTVTIETLEN